jgi:hypothetical protein
MSGGAKPASAHALRSGHFETQVRHDGLNRFFDRLG